MRGGTSDKDAKHMAGLMSDFVGGLPMGMGFVGVMFTLNDPTFDAALMSNAMPQEFAPVLRAWLVRYDAGEAS
jgi:hypothetical protein